MNPSIRPPSQLVFYLRSLPQAEHVAEQYRDKLNGPLGLDIEYRPNYFKGRPPNKTALIQLASNSLVLLVQVSAMPKFPRSIKNIIEDPAIIKAGVGIEGDAGKLWRDFGISACSCLELGNLARAVDPQWTTWKGGIGLARLYKAYEDRELKKRKEIQLSNWERTLTKEQQDYAAADANASFTVLQKLCAILPAFNPAPPQAEYLFHMSQGQKTLSGAPFPPLPVIVPAVAISNPSPATTASPANVTPVPM